MTPFLHFLQVRRNRQVRHGSVLVQREMERGRCPLVSIPPFEAGIFKALGSTDPLRIQKQRKKQVPALPSIVSISPAGYPSAWLRPRIACLRFARQDHCSSTTSFGLNFRMARYPGVFTIGSIRDRDIGASADHRR